MDLTALDPSWSAAMTGSSWVSFENTVCPGCSLTQTAYDQYMATLGMHFITPGTTYDFTQDFVVPAGYEVTGGELDVYSDDMVAINLVNSVFPGSGTEILSNDGYSHYCNCTIPPGSNNIVTKVSMPATDIGPDLKAGADNQLEFSVTQGNGESSYGVDWALTLDLTPLNIHPTSTPEPSTLSILVLGVLGLLFYKRQQ